MDPVKEAIEEMLLAPKEALLYGELKGATTALRDAEQAFTAEKHAAEQALNQSPKLAALRDAQARYKAALEAFNQHIAPVG